MYFFLVIRIGINHLDKVLDPLVKKGLKSVLLFGVLSRLTKVMNSFPIAMPYVDLLYHTISGSSLSFWSYYSHMGKYYTGNFGCVRGGFWQCSKFMLWNFAG